MYPIILGERTNTLAYRKSNNWSKGILSSIWTAVELLKSMNLFNLAFIACFLSGKKKDV